MSLDFQATAKRLAELAETSPTPEGRKEVSEVALSKWEGLQVAAVLKYKDQRGNWPKTLREAGVADASFGDRWMLGYLCENQRPFMFYAATFVIFDTYTYDFGARRWEFTPD